MLHNSRDEFFRSPFGAVACETPMTIRFRCDHVKASVTLRLWWDDEEQKLPMTAEEGGVFEVHFDLPDHPGLLWYYFIVEMWEGSMLYYGNAYDKLGGVGAEYPHEPPSYQLTVYDKAYDTPHWMRDGVMYHIMVDRFHQSMPVSERPVPENGHWHMDWYEAPELNLDAKTSDNMADDFFGGDLEGIRRKLSYLKDLGVTVLYLSPIFKSRSNHKYNTGDYMQIDPSFGTQQDFETLCKDAEAMGIRVMLDGVFSHTGSDSRYFNREGTYDTIGAYQSETSEFSSWYNFTNWPDEYESWWGFDTLPCVKKMDESFLDFIIRGDDAVCAHWVNAGSSGWRLDVADELPLEFLRMMRERIKKEKADSALLGEVWEDASCKIAYDELRCYCLGDTLDSSMNYPLRETMFDFLMGRISAWQFVRKIEHMQENYPAPFFYSLMNLVGSHDKARAINVLADCGEMEPLRADRTGMKLSGSDYQRGKKRLLLAWRFICAMPGMPSLYYGDEVGMQGMADPFCRRPYPWGDEDQDLLQAMKEAISDRMHSRVWTRGGMKLYAPSDDVLVVARPGEEGIGICAINRSSQRKLIQIPPDDVLKEGLKMGVKGMRWEHAVMPHSEMAEYLA